MLNRRNFIKGAAAVIATIPFVGVVKAVNSIKEINTFPKLDYRNTIILAGRRRGKSYWTAQQAVMYMLKGKKVVVIGHNYGSYKYLRDTIFKVTKNSKLPPFTYLSSNTGKMAVPNGGEIKFISAESTNKLRGVKANIVFIDEFDTLPKEQQKEVFTSVQNCVITNPSGQIIITTTPLPRWNSICHQLWENSTWARYRIV